MAMAGLESSTRYLQVLVEDSAERELLAKDLLINVTHFFRDPAAFALLGGQIIPDIARQQTLAGLCASGCLAAAPAKRGDQ